jgi:hypothetical protein
MCGIVGVIVKGDTGLQLRHESVFRELLYADALRGFDSTGVVGINKYGDFGWMKEATPAAIFIPKLELNELWKEMWSRGKVWIGHNRKKTIGDISDETAHPFIIDETFAMVHNGTLTAWTHLSKKGKIDSECLAYLLKEAFDQDNWKDALEEALGKVYGAYALAMYDQNRNKLYLLRNKERPLWRIEVDDCHIFVSEGNMGQWILNRNSYPHDKMKITPIEEHVLHTYDLEKGLWSTEAINPKKYTVVQDTKPSSRTTKTNLGAITTAKKGSRKAVTASHLKFLKRKLLGTKVDFWVDSLYEHDLPKTIAEGALDVCLFGESDDIDWTHQLFADVNLGHYQMDNEEIVMESKWKGSIKAVNLNATGNCLYIDLENVKPYAKYVPKAGVNPMHEFFRKALEEKPLTQLRQEFNFMEFKLNDWQIDLYEEIIAKKVAECKALEEELAASKPQNEGHDAVSLSVKAHDELMKTRFSALKAALKAAAEEGKSIKCSSEQGRWIWRDEKGEIVYESPVALIH